MTPLAKTPPPPSPHAAPSATSAPGRGSAWAVVLLGLVAAAMMVPPFALFIPIVVTAWVLARTGLLPSFVRHRQPALRFRCGPDTDPSVLIASMEAEAPDDAAAALINDMASRADGLAGARGTSERGTITWSAAPASPPTTSPDRLAADLADWPAVREALASGARLVLATHARSPTGRGRTTACLAGQRALLESIALGSAAELRTAGTEVVTTGWLRHAERVRASRRKRGNGAARTARSARAPQGGGKLST